jgi:hypothetical protein
VIENSLYQACLQVAKAPVKDWHAPIFVGIDPGATGAVALLAWGKAFVGDIPVLKVKKSGGGYKTEMNIPAALQALRVLGPVRNQIRVAVEQAQVQAPGARGGAGAFGATTMTAFRVGTSFGIWLGVLATMGLPYARIAPQAWKRSLGLSGKDKEASRLLALELFPGTDLNLKKHSDRAEAVLIAEYHRRKLNGGD